MKDIDWPYKNLTPKQFERLTKRTGSYYPHIDIAGYIITILEERPEIDKAEVFRFLSNGMGKSKPHLSTLREGEKLKSPSTRRRSSKNKNPIITPIRTF